ncbi:MAG: DUF202 domain-containing protein [Flavobacteriales bacterium]|jgi:putative membrane protein|nr:DUF202 domain-containing protein [Flavobacteriales bacterium]
MAFNWFRPDHGYDVREELILRDHLALVRTRLANERTLLSYIRSTLYLLVGGLTLIGLGDTPYLRGVGHVSWLLSVLVLLFGLYRYVTLRNHINTYYQHQVSTTTAQAR